MNSEEVKKILDHASSKVPQGIYATEYHGDIELYVLPMSKTRIKKHVREYKREGIKVYANY